MTRIAWIGLGVMGFPMAGHLSNAGYDVTVFNRTQETRNQWTELYNGKSASTPAEAAINAEVILVCVGNDNDLREVVLGENGVFSVMSTNTILIDHTTTSASVAKEIFKMALEKGIHFIDAPVSGGQIGAENGVLSVMCGGEKTAFNRVENILSVYSQTCKLIGDAGSGQLAKMVNQICIAGVVQGLAEALNFGRNSGLDCEAVLDVISKGAAGSWQMTNRGTTMLKDEYEFGFAVDWMRKDLGFCLDEANRNRSPLPLISMVDQFYKEVQIIGGGRWDTSSLLYRMTSLDKLKNKQQQ